MASTTIEHSVRFQHRLTNDASEHAQTQDWLSIEYSQLDTGEYKGGITKRQLGPVTSFLEYQNKAVHKCAQVPANLCTVSMIDQGHDAARFMRHSMKQNDLFFLMPANTDCDLVIPGGVTSTYSVMDQSGLQSAMRALSEQDWEHHFSGLQVFKSHSSRLLLDQLFRIALDANNQIGEQASIGDQLGQQVMHQMALIIHKTNSDNVLADNGLHLRQRRLEVVRKTRDYILACLDRDFSPSVVSICENIGVGARVLQYSFNEYLQITPINYLRILRLHKVRQQLMTPLHEDLKVTDIATRFGFLHLSNFSRDYFTLFGEKPSMTLQCALRANVPSN